MDKKDIQNKAAENLLNKPVSFAIKGLGSFNIKPLKLGTLICISRQALKIKTLKEGDSILTVIGTTPESAKPATRVVALAVLNSRIKIFLFSRLLAWLFLFKLSPTELKSLMELIISKSEANDFFLSTALLKGMNVLETRQGEAVNKKAVKQSTESLEK